MNTLGTFATATVVGLISGPNGMNANLASLNTADNLVAPLIDTSQIYQQNVAAELAEKSTVVKYPSVYIYCEKYANNLTEKFRSFSGDVQMAVEVRHSQDRLDGLQDSLELYVDSVTAVLDAERGDWGNGLYYAGGYDVSLGAVKHGGKNFLQTAKISFQIEVSRS